MGLGKYKLGELIQIHDERNVELAYGLNDVKGISIQKEFIETKADMSGVSLKPYILVKPGCFAYVTVTSRNGEKITIAHNNTNNTYIISSSYIVFRVKRTDLLLPDYLFMYFMVREAIACTGIENVVDEHKSVDLFSDEFIEQLNTVKLPITKFNALLKLLRKAISAYGRTNKVKAMEFDERLRKVVDDYNSRDKLVFTNEVVSDFVNDLSDQLLQILRDLQEDQSSFQKMGISFEEKAFYDILVKVRDDHGFPYADEKCVVLAKKIKELVDDKAQFADWSTRDDIKNQLNMELTVLLYQNGYPPEWDEEVFEKVMEQAENFKKYAD